MGHDLRRRRIDPARAIHLEEPILSQPKGKIRRNETAQDGESVGIGGHHLCQPPVFPQLRPGVEIALDQREIAKPQPVGGQVPDLR